MNRFKSSLQSTFHKSPANTETATGAAGTTATETTTEPGTAQIGDGTGSEIAQNEHDVVTEPFSGNGEKASSDSSPIDSGEETQGPPPKPKHNKLSSIPLKDWRRLGFKLSILYLFLFVLWLAFLSIYWATLYKREKRVGNMQMVVVIEDQIFKTRNGTIMPPVIGPAFVEMLNANTNLGEYSIIYGQGLFEQLDNKTSPYDVVSEGVLNEEVWAGFYINKTALEMVYNMLGNYNSSKNYTMELQYMVNCIFNSGRLYSALSQYLRRSINTLSLSWAQQFAPLAYADLFQNAFTPQEQSSIIQANGASLNASALTYYPAINERDLRLSSSSVVLGPSELGLVYAQIFAFHQFNFAADLHTTLIHELKFLHLLLYRFTFSQLNFLVLSLVYALLTIAFQVPVGYAFGQGGGFMVLWMTMYMFFSATGGTMEVLGTFVRYMGKTYLLPPIMFFLIVVNISCTFGALVLSPGLYHYGKGLPMFNTFEALKVVFFNTWRGTLGRNYGVLAAWIVLNTLTFTYLLFYIRRHPREDKPLI